MPLSAADPSAGANDGARERVTGATYADGPVAVANLASKVAPRLDIRPVLQEE